MSLKANKSYISINSNHTSEIKKTTLIKFNLKEDQKLRKKGKIFFYFKNNYKVWMEIINTFSR